MNTAAVFLLVAALASVGGSLLLYVGHRARRSAPLDFHEQLRAIAPHQSEGTTGQPSGIVRIEPWSDEER